MVRKKLACMVMAAAFAVLTALPSFASIKVTDVAPKGWKRDDRGWWFENKDGSYTKGGWQWIGKKCYYFDDIGYMYENRTTPDGYTVDENGAWTVDGVVQIKEEVKADEKGFNTNVTEKFGNLTCITPTAIKDRGNYYEAEAVVSKGIPEADGSTERFDAVIRIRKDAKVHMLKGDRIIDIDLVEYMIIGNKKYKNWRMFAPDKTSVVLDSEGYIVEFYDIVGR